MNLQETIRHQQSEIKKHSDIISTMEINFSSYKDIGVSPWGIYNKEDVAKSRAEQKKRKQVMKYLVQLQKMLKEK